MNYTESLSANEQLVSALDLLNSCRDAEAIERAESATSEWALQLKAVGRRSTWAVGKERAQKAVAKALQEVFPGNEPLSEEKPSETPPFLNNSFLSDEQKAVKAIQIAYASHEEVRRYCRSLDKVDPIRPDHMDMSYARLSRRNFFKGKL